MNSKESLWNTTTIPRTVVDSASCVWVSVWTTLRRVTNRPTVRQVWPIPTVASPDPIGAAYGVERPRPADRPWVAMTMINSIDGRTHVDGNSKGLGNANDSAVLATMRKACDVVLVGSTTAIADGYGPPSKPGQRIAVVTRSGDIDLTTPLFSSGAGMLVTTNEATVPATAAVDVVRAGDGAIDFRVALQRIDEMLGGVNTVNLEGGPTLNGLLRDAGLIDEVNLTTAPLVLGGASAPVINHADGGLDRWTLAHQLIDDDGYVFSRWVRQR